MDMKGHITAALREHFDQWEAFLAGLSDEALLAPQADSHWSTKDVVAHLWAWQQRTIARLDAVLSETPPVFPQWSAGEDPDADDFLERTNAWLYEAYRHRSWPEVHEEWRRGFLRFLQLAEKIPERDLLDSSLAEWLQGLPPAYFLLASYEHHHDHLEALLAPHGRRGDA